MSKIIQLGDYISTLKGFAFKSQWYEKDGHPIVKVSDFTENSIVTSKLVKIPFEVAEKYKKYALKTNDIVIQTVGSWPSNPASVVGKTIKVPFQAHGSLLNQNAVIIYPDENIVQSYLYYVLKDQNFKDYIVGTAQGAASQASITLDAIKGFELELPDQEVQQKIASILSAYDDLIENNNHRIAILEEMARSLYREWFVKFRFPGHEAVKMVDSELGQIPEGWEIHKVNDLFSLNIGKTPPRNEAQWFTYNQGLQWVSIRDMGSNQIFLLNTAENLTDDAIEKFNFRIVPSDTVIMSFKLTVGKVSITTENMVTNEAIAHFNIKNNAMLCKEYVYFYLQHFQFQTLGNTSSIGNAINSQVVKSMPFLLPDQFLMKNYQNCIDPIFKQILKLLKSNLNLKTQRDMLLPKLISGKIKAI